jgi:hypothetical protein
VFQKSASKFNAIAVYTFDAWLLHIFLNRPMASKNDLKLPKPGVDVMITNFCDFCQFSAKKLAFFSKTNVMINDLKKLL